MTLKTTRSATTKAKKGEKPVLKLPGGVPKPNKKGVRELDASQMHRGEADLRGKSTQYVSIG